MKKFVFFEILKLLMERRELRKKVRKYAFVAFAFMVFFGGLAIWGGVSLVNYAISSTKDIANSPAFSQKVSNAKNNFERIKIKPNECKDEVFGLLAIEPWLNEGPINTLKNLTASCIEIKSELCNENKCDQIKDHHNNSNRRTI